MTRVVRQMIIGTLLVWFLTAAITAAIILLLGCSHPLRLDPNRQDLQWKQQRCLDEGRPPPECRP